MSDSHGGSLNKRISPRYQKISSNSNVDESLFGNKKASDTSDIGSSRRIVSGPLNSQAIIISKDELDRLKIAGTLKSEAQLQQEKEERERIKAEKEKKSRERKARMIELEALAKKNAKKSDIQLAEEAKAQAFREMADQKVVDETDVVKLLSTLGQRAATFTLREAQIQEKHNREEKEHQFERRMDMIMEVDRIKDLQRREEEENEKRQKRLADRQVITDQIEERQRMKIMQAEMREQENQNMLQTLKKYQNDDIIAAARRQKAVELSRLEVLRANEDSIRRKQELKQREVQEMEEILLYQQRRDRELAKREEDEANAAQQKKELQAKLLATQERSQGNKSEVDELRARRAAEHKEREFRAKEKLLAQKKADELEDLNFARRKQAADRKAREDALLAEEQEQLYHAAVYSKKMSDREAHEAAVKAEKAKEHREGIMDQISKREDHQKRTKAAKFEEGAGSREKFIHDLSKLETIREKMVGDLESQGVNPRYLSEMRAVDIKKILNR